MGFAPTGKRRLCTAHANGGRRCLREQLSSSSRFRSLAIQQPRRAFMEFLYFEGLIHIVFICVLLVLLLE